MSERLLRRETWIPRGIDKVFEFFSRAENLEKLTPPLVGFQILTPTPIAMKSGALIDYKIRIHGVPVRWRTKITVWEPPLRFVDEQLAGPYRQWIHEHRFHAEGEGTRMVDTVRYRAPGWFLEPLIHRVFVGPDLKKIFDFRELKMKELFGGGAAGAAAEQVPTQSKNHTPSST